MKRLVVFIMAVCLLACSACGNADERSDTQVVLTTGFEEDELFFIGENKCYLPEARLYMRTLETNYEAMYGSEIMGRQTGDIKVSDRLTNLALSRLAQVKAMGLLANERGVTLTERENDKCGQAADRYMQSLSEADLADLQVDRALLLGMYKDYALANKVYRDITDGISPEISDDEARTITIQRILLQGDDAMQTANTVYSLAVEGASFDSLIDDYNSVSTSKYSFGKDTDEFSSEFVAACFDLSVNEISLPLVTEEGVSIVKCVNAFDPDETDANKIRIVEKRKGEAFDEIYDTFVQGLYTNFNSDLWDAQMFTFHRLDTDENFFEVYDDIFSIGF